MVKIGAKRGRFEAEKGKAEISVKGTDLFSLIQKKGAKKGTDLFF